MSGGYWNRVLVVDLEQGTSHDEVLDAGARDLLLGGSGLGAWLWEHHSVPGAGALQPGNALVFAAGPLTGTFAPTSGRHEVVTRSPATGAYGEGDAGGTFGTALKRAGYDALVITGAAARASVLVVDGDQVRLEDATDLWGKDVIDADTALRARLGRGFSTALIGPAGENLVLMANIVHDGADARVAGRGGLGAVLGSKFLKGVAARGTKQVPVHDPDALKQLMRETVPVMREQAVGMHLYGTTGGVQRAEEAGDLPIRNWRDGSFPQAGALSGEAIAERLIGTYHCAGCPIGCGRTVRLHVPGHEGQDGAGLEYESVGALGSLLMLGDLDVVEQAASLCNVFGLDTISTGGTLATAMEARELGLVTITDTDGIDLVWGNGAAVLAMIPRIARRQGFGTRLADGSRRFASSVGHPELAIEVKGMELPAHDPRAYVSLGLGYATATRGACHLQGFSYAFERAATMPEIGLKVPMDRFDHTGKVAMVKATQDLMGLFDSLKFCKFAIYGGLNLTQMGQFVTAVTGRPLSVDDLMEVGERIYTYKRLLATRMGISRADDTLPERLLSTDRGGSVAGHLAWLDADVLNEYYDLRGWDRLGVPTVATVTRLKIDQLITAGSAPEG
jgi:aldehyde:ferredoxin oxidoreductase